MRRTITVDGLSCGHCEETVEAVLEAVSGVTAARADRDAGDVTVEGDADVETLVR